MLKLDAERNGKQNGVRPRGGPLKFGDGIDARAAGRRGGQASVLSRRLRKQRQLEERITATKNGAAIAVVYRTTLERERALEQERMRLDTTVMQLMDWADQERAMIGRLRERRRQYEQAVTERLEALEQREAELRARLESDTGLDEWLREVGPERVEESGERLGWFDREVDDASSVQS